MDLHSALGVGASFALVLFAGLSSFDAALSVAIAVVFVGPTGWGAGAALALGFWASVRRVPLSPLTRPGRAIAGLASLFFAIGCVSWLANGAPSSSVTAWLLPMAERLVVAVVVMRIASDTVAWSVVRGLLLGGIVQAAVGLAQSSGLIADNRVAWAAPGVSLARVSGTAVDPNYYALGLALVVAFALACKQPPRRTLSLATLAGCSAAIVYSLSRTGFIALGAAILVWMILERGVAIRERQRRPVVGVVMFLIAAVVFAGPSDLLARFGQIGGSVHVSSAAERVVLWHTARHVFAEHPLVGVGPDQVRYVMASIGGPDFPRPAIGSLPLSAHNTPLDVAADLGILGIVAWLMLLWVCLREGMRKIRSFDGLDRAIAVGSVAALAGFVAGSFFVTAELTLPYWLVLGLMGRPARSEVRREASRAGRTHELSGTRS